MILDHNVFVRVSFQVFQASQRFASRLSGGILLRSDQLTLSSLGLWAVKEPHTLHDSSTAALAVSSLSDKVSPLVRVESTWRSALGIPQTL